MALTLYYSSVSGSTELKKKQQRIMLILDSKKIEYQPKDLAGDEAFKSEMREIMGDPNGLPPQLTKGDIYLGGFEEFEIAVECESLEEFLKLK